MSSSSWFCFGIRFGSLLPADGGNAVLNRGKETVHDRGETAEQKEPDETDQSTRSDSCRNQIAVEIPHQQAGPAKPFPLFFWADNIPGFVTALLNVVVAVVAGVVFWLVPDKFIAVTEEVASGSATLNPFPDNREIDPLAAKLAHHLQNVVPLRTGEMFPNLIRVINSRLDSRFVPRVGADLEFMLCDQLGCRSVMSQFRDPHTEFVKMLLAVLLSEVQMGFIHHDVGTGDIFILKERPRPPLPVHPCLEFVLGDQLQTGFDFFDGFADELG